jgi:hypothetical protein
MDIKLNLYDLYKMAKELGFSSTEMLFTKGYVELVEGQNGLKLATMKFKIKPVMFCPFLINDVDDNFKLRGFCSLHPYKKPLVCILAPISREYDVDSKTSNYFTTHPTENCPGTYSKNDVELSTMLQPINNEIKYEEIYYDILDMILTHNITDYFAPLYHFNTSSTFPEIISSIYNYFTT